MRLSITPRFLRAYKHLTRQEQEMIKQALDRLQRDPQHPGLRVKKMQGYPNVWEARASRDLRITFTVEPDRAILRNCGHHDETLRNP